MALALTIVWCFRLVLQAIDKFNDRVYYTSIWCLQTLLSILAWLTNPKVISCTVAVVGILVVSAYFFPKFRDLLKNSGKGTTTQAAAFWEVTTASASNLWERIKKSYLYLWGHIWRDTLVHRLVLIIFLLQTVYPLVRQWGDTLLQSITFRQQASAIFLHLESAYQTYAKLGPFWVGAAYFVLGITVFVILVTILATSWLLMTFKFRKVRFWRSLFLMLSFRQYSLDTQKEQERQKYRHWKSVALHFGALAKILTVLERVVRLAGLLLISYFITYLCEQLCHVMEVLHYYLCVGVTNSFFTYSGQPCAALRWAIQALRSHNALAAVGIILSFIYQLGITLTKLLGSFVIDTLDSASPESQEELLYRRMTDSLDAEDLRISLTATRRVSRLLESCQQSLEDFATEAAVANRARDEEAAIARGKERETERAREAEARGETAAQGGLRRSPRVAQTITFS
jgi:hypothetical protein